MLSDVRRLLESVDLEGHRLESDQKQQKKYRHDNSVADRCSCPRTNPRNTS